MEFTKPSVTNAIVQLGFMEDLYILDAEPDRAASYETVTDNLKFQTILSGQTAELPNNIKGSCITLNLKELINYLREERDIPVMIYPYFLDGIVYMYLIEDLE